MRLIIISTMLLPGLTFAQTGADGGKKVYFLNDDSHKQWCGYASESRLRAQVQALGAMIVGGVDYKNGRVSSIHVTETDETGDWAVNDEYTFDEKGMIHGLTRTIDIIPEDNSEEQTFLIQNGKAIKQRSTHRELHTGKPTPKTVDWFKAPPVITDIKAFPFSALIIGNRQAMLPTDEVCIPENAQ